MCIYKHRDSSEKKNKTKIRRRKKNQRKPYVKPRKSMVAFSTVNQGVRVWLNRLFQRATSSTILRGKNAKRVPHKPANHDRQKYIQPGSPVGPTAPPPIAKSNHGPDHATSSPTSDVDLRPDANRFSEPKPGGSISTLLLGASASRALAVLVVTLSLGGESSDHSLVTCLELV